MYCRYWESDLSLLEKEFIERARPETLWCWIGRGVFNELIVFRMDEKIR